MKHDDWQTSDRATDNSSKLNLPKKTAHLACLPERRAEGARHVTGVALGCTPLFLSGKAFAPKAIWLPAGGPGTVVSLPTRRCDFSNWQSLFKCLATSWQMPMLTVGRGTPTACKGEVERMMSEAEFSHYIDSSFSLPPSLESRDTSHIIGCSGERHYSKKSQMPSEEHLFCRVSTKITLGPWETGWGWGVPEEGRRRKHKWRICCLTNSTIPGWQAMDNGDGQTEPRFRGQQRKPFFLWNLCHDSKHLDKRRPAWSAKSPGVGIQQLLLFHSFCHSTDIC